MNTSPSQTELPVERLEVERLFFNNANIAKSSVLQIDKVRP